MTRPSTPVDSAFQLLAGLDRQAALYEPARIRKNLAQGTDPGRPSTGFSVALRSPYRAG
jgi:hypothetical protein